MNSYKWSRKALKNIKEMRYLELSVVGGCHYHLGLQVQGENRR